MSLATDLFAPRGKGGREPSIAERIDISSNCWLWTGAASSGRPTAPNGYGKINTKIDGEYRVVYAHRLVYESLVGEIPDGFDLDHLCRNTLCVNPDHLEPVTRSVNLKRGVRWP